MDDATALVLAMNYMCRVAYREGLEGFTKTERVALFCYVGFEPTRLPKSSLSLLPRSEELLKDFPVTT